MFGVDKFPRMVDYVVPTGVRVADADRVRLGAHLGEGTTVMHEGFVNFNAGTLGKSMVEGRISAGVVVDDGSDIGGGASIMGTLSGGGKEVTIAGCLLGANAGCGIPLGDGCAVEAGLYITAGTKVTITDLTTTAGGQSPRALGRDSVLFRRNRVTGAVEAVPGGARARPQRRAPRQLTRPDAMTHGRRAERGRRPGGRRRVALVGGGGAAVVRRPPGPGAGLHRDGRRDDGRASAPSRLRTPR